MADEMIGFDEAPVFRKLPKLTPGRYVLEVTKVKKVTSTQDSSQTYFIGEFRVLQASNGADTQVGDMVGDSLPTFGKYKKTYFGKIKEMIGGILNKDPGDIKVSRIDEVTSVENPLAGLKVKAMATGATSKEQNEYTRVTYTPYRPPSAAATTATTAEATT